MRLLAIPIERNDQKALETWPPHYEPPPNILFNETNWSNWSGKGYYIWNTVLTQHISNKPLRGFGFVLGKAGMPLSPFYFGLTSNNKWILKEKITAADIIDVTTWYWIILDGIDIQKIDINMSFKTDIYESPIDFWTIARTDDGNIMFFTLSDF